jgi:LPXTG-motif cell wall-anchored protein
MDIAIQAALWLGAGVTLALLLARRRKRRAIH